MSDLSCKHCNKLFTDLLDGQKKNEKVNHIRWCDPLVDRSGSKFQLRCCRIICKREMNIQNLNRHMQSHLPPVFKNSCLQCGADTNTKFCSNSCSATYNNLNAPATRKFGPARSSVKRPRVYSKLPKPCVICKILHKGSGESCSPECKSALLSVRIKSAIHNGIFDPKKNRGRGKRSFLEKSFKSWLESKNILFLEEEPFRRLDMVKTYFADFYFPELKLIIELDGTQHKKTIEYDLDRDNYIQTTYDVRIVRVTHKEYVSKSRLSEISELLQLKN